MNSLFADPLAEEYCPPVQIPKDKRPTFVDLFAGCGGLSLGFEEAGWRPLMVSELNKDALETYLLNRDREHPALRRFAVGDVKKLTSDSNRDSIRSALLDAYGLTDIDAVIGGPPCQGYSEIGHRRTFSSLRKEDIPSNHLYLEMIAVIKAINPKVFLFENVRGITNGRWSPDGVPGEIWEEIQSRFALDGYQTAWDIVEAKEYGVPQNRPRVLLVGVRSNLGVKLNSSGRAKGLLPRPSGRPPNPQDLLGDLVDPLYQETYATSVYPSDAAPGIQRALRTRPVDRRVFRKGEPVTDHEYSRHAPRIVAKFKWMIDHEGKMRVPDRTKKFNQRVLPAEWPDRGPTVTATSLPDDLVHYLQPRTLTVREWARLQMFPDWYQFAGNRTTGGRRRAGDPSAGIWEREVPKYTQIGNAVPVLLARKIAAHLAQLVR